MEICRQQLEADDREDYVPLVTEARVRSSIRVALESYRLVLERQGMTYGKDYPWARDEEVSKQGGHFEDVVRPVYLEVADKGSWPQGASFFYYLWKDDYNSVRYDGLNLRLWVETPGGMFQGFSLPILDVYYGRFGPTWEEDSG
ncbi:MAG TPA: hypothetical protein VM914_11620 [Pyrinomonadaceae bacterium]|nr:hypothetical protein [Pyrinomonadaceae bacterium]